MKIAILGPEGTFSHEAAMRFRKNADLLFKRTIWDVFESINSNEAECGIVPLENSISGTVGATLDALMEFDLQITSEQILPINHQLVGYSDLGDIKSVYVNAQTYAQCEKFFRKYLPEATIIETSSNGKSAETVSKLKDDSKAAIVPKIAAERYQLKIIRKNIQDNRFNVTRFLVLGKSKTEQSGHDRTSIAIYPQIDKPGLLYDLLGEFSKRKINLTKIESRPSKGKLGDYIFYIDLEGHRDNKQIQEAFTEIEKSFFLKVLGSYPREY